MGKANFLNKIIESARNVSQFQGLTATLEDPPSRDFPLPASVVNFYVGQ